MKFIELPWYNTFMAQRFIENISRSECSNGTHYDPGINSMLIQISDPGAGFPTPNYNFKEIHQFEFLDIEEDGMSNDGSGNPVDMSEFKITDEQAQQLVNLLYKAKEKHMNVIVHCHAGICRSGAVVEVAEMLGFTPVDRFRQPNLLVKHKMMKALGWTYDAEETPVYQEAEYLVKMKWEE